MVKIEQIVQQIKHTNSEDDQGYLSDYLADLVKYTSPSEIDDRTIDDIASLLAVPYVPQKVNRKLAHIVGYSDEEIQQGNGPWGIAEMVTKNDRVRAYAAITLGEIGPRASRAIPALDKALCEIRNREDKFLIRRGTDSGDSICIAFYKIGGKKEQAKHDCALSKDGHMYIGSWGQKAKP